MLWPTKCNMWWWLTKSWRLPRLWAGNTIKWLSTLKQISHKPETASVKCGVHQWTVHGPQCVRIHFDKRSYVFMCVYVSNRTYVLPSNRRTINAAVVWYDTMICSISSTMTIHVACSNVWPAHVAQWSKHSDAERWDHTAVQCTCPGRGRELFKPFTRHCGNTICPDKWMNVLSGRTAHKT